MDTATNILDNLFEVDMKRAAILLRHYTDNGQPVFLWGKPGIGKTDIAHQLGTETSRKVIEFHAALREPVDVRGVPSVINGITHWNVPDELPREEETHAWALIAWGLALMGAQAHRRDRPLGRALAESGFAEGFTTHGWSTCISAPKTTAR